MKCFEVKVEKAEICEYLVANPLAFFLVDGSKSIYEQPSSDVEAYVERYETLYTRYPCQAGAAKSANRKSEDDANSSGSSDYVQIATHMEVEDGKTYHSPYTPTHYLQAESLSYFVDQVRKDFKL